MNLAVFITHDTIAKLEPLFGRMAELQRTTANGCLCAVASATLPKERVLQALGDLPSRFKASAHLPVQTNSDFTLAARHAQMFGRFLLGAYSRYPGPWLMFDEPAEPVKEDFMQELLRQHGSHGGRMTGRGRKDVGSIEPVGPVTLELPQQGLRFLRYGTNESWRSRGRYHFQRAGFQLVEPGEWLFRMEPAERAELVANESGQPVDSLGNDALIQLIEQRTGKRPHHFTGREKLISMAQETSPAIP